MVRDECNKLEEQLVTSASHTLAMLEEENKAKEDGLTAKFDNLVEQRQGFTTDKLGKIGQMQEEMAHIEAELDKKQEIFDKLKEDFEKNPLPEAVETPRASITHALNLSNLHTLAIMGKDDDEEPEEKKEFTELPKDDEDLDESTSLAVRLAM